MNNEIRNEMTNLEVLVVGNKSLIRHLSVESVEHVVHLLRKFSRFFISFECFRVIVGVKLQPVGHGITKNLLNIMKFIFIMEVAFNFTDH